MIKLPTSGIRTPSSEIRRPYLNCSVVITDLGLKPQLASFNMISRNEVVVVVTFSEFLDCCVSFLFPWSLVGLALQFMYYVPRFSNVRISLVHVVALLCLVSMTI